MKADDDTASSIADNTNVSAFDAFGAIEVVDLLVDTAQQSGQKFFVEIGVPDSPDLLNQVNTRAVAFAKERAGELITDLEDSTRNDIRDTIATGLEDGMSVGQLSDKLEEMYSFSADRADIIARNEINIAGNQGVLAGMKELRSQGAKIKKAWNPDDGACPICVENGDAGFIDLDDTFPSGDDAPTAHVNCECNLISEFQDDKEDDE